jgi:RNA polymerase sigma-70 factor (ECF subfamily)
MPRQNSQVPFSVLQTDGQIVPQPEAPAGDEVERRDEARRVLREVEALPEELRTVLMLFYYQQSSYRDIAHLLDVSPATVNARLTRARALLRDRLGRNGTSLDLPARPTLPSDPASGS